MPVTDQHVTPQKPTEIWVARLAHVRQYRAGMQRLLNPAEQARCQRYLQQDDRDRYLGGRALAKLAAASYCQIHWNEVSVILHESGKPAVLLNPASAMLPHISISHSGDLIAVAVSFDGDIGIDVELLHRDVNIDDLAQVVCSASEIAEIFRVADHAMTQRFYAFWVLKEAYLKATGDGLSADARNLVFSIDADLQVRLLRGLDTGKNAAWSFFLKQYDDRHMMALATRQRKKIALDSGQISAVLPPRFIDVLPVLQVSCA